LRVKRAARERKRTNHREKTSSDSLAPRSIFNTTAQQRFKRERSELTVRLRSRLNQKDSKESNTKRKRLFSKAQVSKNDEKKKKAGRV